MKIHKSVLEATCEKCGILYRDCNIVIEDDGTKQTLCHKCTKIIQSKIFTSAEMSALFKRLDGDKRDTTSIYSNRVKPKIHELIEVWFPKKKRLEKLL